MVKGLEETVPLDIVSLESGQVITVVGDYDGGLYSAVEGSYDTYPSTVHTPEMGTTHGIAAAVDGSLVVRAGSKSSYVQYSTDKGKTWNYCSGGKEGSGHVAVSANGSIILHCPNTSNGYSYDGTGSTVYYSTNRGTSWTQCNGISINGAYPVADGANSNKFYVTNGNTVYVSTDGGKNFSAKGTTGYTSYYKMRAVPGVEGDVWAPCGTNGLYRSTNSATSFTKMNGISMCEAVGFGKAAEGKTFPTVFVWATINGTTGIFRSTDEGQTWVRINDDMHQFGGPGNGQFVMGDMAVYGTVFMSTVGRGVVYGVTAGEIDPLVQQSISLNQGWNLISLYVNPNDKSFASVLASCDYKIIKNNDGFYFPAHAENLQSITEFVPGEGYLIYCNTAGTIETEGQLLDIASSNLKTGWNLVGVPVSVGKNVAKLPTSVLEVKDLSDAPVDILQPGKAYFINVSADTTVEW